MNIELKALIDRLNAYCRKALESGAEACVRQTHYNVEIEHLLQALLDLDGSDVHHILRYYEVDPAAVTAELTTAIDRFKRGNSRTPAFSPHVPRLLEQGWMLSSLHLHDAQVRTGALLLALLEDSALRGVISESAPSLLKIQRESLKQDLAELVRFSDEQSMRGEPVAAPKARETAVLAGGPAPGSAARASQGGRSDSALARFTVDLTGEARAGKIDPIRGRDLEIRQIVDILMRRRQNNPILTGEAGVGKTAVVEGFALRVAAGTVPPALQSAAVHALDLGLLQAGAGVKGEFEHRLKTVIEEVKASPTPIILFIDEAHTLIGAGGAEGQGDAANLLKPALARGELRTIAATTWSEYKKYVEKDPALARRFQVVKVDEPDEPTAVEMLRGVATNLERHHGVRVLEEAIRDAVALSHRYMPGRQLPDKAISVLDTACARVAIGQNAPPAALEAAQRSVTQIDLELEILQREQKGGVDHGERVRELEHQHVRARADAADAEARWQRELEIVVDVNRLRAELEAAEGAAATDTAHQLAALEARLETIQGEAPLVPTCVSSKVVASVISDWTGIPVGKMVRDEIRAVMTLKPRMEDRIIGQTEALEVISNRIRTYRASLDDPGKPVGVFLLVGPSGVGKTETAITLAEYLYGGERNLITVNMSEYQEAHTVSSLKGAPPGYVGYGKGGVLTEAVKRRPYSVVLLDEIEKAHPDVLELFYQVFDKGVMEDGEGQLIDFKNTIILLTSNVGSDAIIDASRNGRPAPDHLLGTIRPELLRHFKAAFLGRLVTVPYYPLKDAEIHEIAELKLARIQRRFWEQYKADLTYEDAVVDRIVERCTEVDSGARNIDHILTQSMLPELSVHILDRMANGEPVGGLHISLGAAGAFAYTLAALPVAG